MEPEHYSRAPITEAIIDLRVKRGESESLEVVDALPLREESEYPSTGNVGPFDYDSVPLQIVGQARVRYQYVGQIPPDSIQMD